MASDDNWMSDIVDCIWHAIETNNDLKVSDSTDGWREAEGGGRNFKWDGEFPFRMDNMPKAGAMPALTIIPTTTSGQFYSSATARIQFSLEVIGMIHTEVMGKVFRFAELVHSELISKIRTNFEDAGNGFTNIIYLYRVPAINFDDITLSRNNIWTFRLPLITEVSKTA